MGVASFSYEVMKSRRKEFDPTALQRWRRRLQLPLLMHAWANNEATSQTFVVSVNMHVTSNFLRDAA